MFVSPISYSLNNAAKYDKSSTKGISAISSSVETEETTNINTNLKSGTYPRKYKETDTSIDA